MTDINKHVARYFNFLESDADATFHRLHTEYSKAVAERDFHHDKRSNPNHFAHHPDVKVRQAHHRAEATWSLADTMSYSIHNRPSDKVQKETYDQAYNLRDKRDSMPAVKAFHDKADKLEKRVNSTREAVRNHYVKYGGPTFPRHPSKPNPDVVHQHTQHLKDKAGPVPKYNDDFDYDYDSWK